MKKALSHHLGRGVKIISGKRKGRFELEFYGPEDLQRLYEAPASPAKGDGGTNHEKAAREKPAKSGHELLEKMGQLIEEQPEASAPPCPGATWEKPTSPNRNRALMTYIAFLFGVAFVLVLLSFLIQQKGLPANHFGAKPNANSAFVPGRAASGQQTGSCWRPTRPFRTRWYSSRLT